jgi:hypothetical protein
VRMTRLHGSAVLGSVRLSLERGDLEPEPVGADQAKRPIARRRRGPKLAITDRA